MPIRLVRRAKSPHWIMRGTVRGVRVEESTGTGDKRAAEEIRAKREAEILAQSVYGRRATATFAEAALSYLECGGIRANGAALCPYECRRAQAHHRSPSWGKSRGSPNQR